MSKTFDSPMMLDRIATVQKLLARRHMTRAELMGELDMGWSSLCAFARHLHETKQVHIARRERKPGGGNNLCYLAWGPGEDAPELPRTVRLTAAEEHARLMEARSVKPRPHPLTVALFGMNP